MLRVLGWDGKGVAAVAELNMWCGVRCWMQRRVVSSWNRGSEQVWDSQHTECCVGTRHGAGATAVTTGGEIVIC